MIIAFTILVIVICLFGCISNFHRHEYEVTRTVPVNIVRADDSEEKGYCQLQICKECKKERAMLIKFHISYEINLDYAKLEFFK